MFGWLFADDDHVCPPPPPPSRGADMAIWYCPWPCWRKWKWTPEKGWYS